MDFYGRYTKTTIARIMILGLSEMMHFLYFMPLSFSFFLLWKYNDLWIGLPIGVGIFAYGLAYFMVHDIFIHQRFKLFKKANNRYAKGIRRAHKIHHKHLGKDKGECFGMLWVPLKYFKNN